MRRVEEPDTRLRTVQIRRGIKLYLAGNYEHVSLRTVQLRRGIKPGSLQHRTCPV